jgi:serine/threonine protein kinase
MLHPAPTPPWRDLTREGVRCRDIRVPEECPQIISDLIESCRQPLPEDRPSAKQVFDVLKAQELRTQRSNSGASSNSFPTRLSVQRSQLAIFD